MEIIILATLIHEEVLQDARAEATRAFNKHGLNTPRSLNLPRQDKLTILVEELGEVARCLTYDKDHAGELYQELIQLAAMALMWATAEMYNNK